MHVNVCPTKSEIAKVLEDAPEPEGNAWNLDFNNQCMQNLGHREEDRISIRGDLGNIKFSCVCEPYHIPESHPEMPSNRAAITAFWIVSERAWKAEAEIAGTTKGEA